MLFHKPRTIVWTAGWALWISVSTAGAQALDPAPPLLRVMTWNVEWMFDDYQGDNRSDLAREQSSPSREYWENKRNRVAELLAEVRPEIVALQEIEGYETLAEITAQLKSAHQLSYRFAFIQGSDRFTEQDVGLLVRGGLTSFRRHEQSKAMFNSEQFYNLSKHLVGEFQWANIASPLTVMNVHLRATSEAEELRIKQARLARHWLDPLIQSGQDVIVLGDFNTEHNISAKMDAANLAIDGTTAPETAADLAPLIGSNAQPRLIDLLSRLADPGQSTHLILNKQFDRILVSESMLVDDPGVDWCFQQIEVFSREVVHGAQDGPEHWSRRLTLPLSELDVSDHFPVMATFELK